jgi:hypothetical protein
MQNPSLIPQGSIITEKMVDEYMAYYGNLTEETAIGGMNIWIDGQGELPAKLMNGNETFYPIMVAYAKANGLAEMPASWFEKLPEVPDTQT